MEKKRLTIDVPVELGQEIKLWAVQSGSSLKDFVISSIVERMKRESLAEDEVLWKMSEEAKKEWFIDDEESDLLIKKISQC